MSQHNWFRPRGFMKITSCQDISVHYRFVHSDLDFFVTLLGELGVNLNALTKPMSSIQQDQLMTIYQTIHSQVQIEFGVCYWPILYLAKGKFHLFLGIHNPMQDNNNQFFTMKQADLILTGLDNAAYLQCLNDLRVAGKKPFVDGGLFKNTIYFQEDVTALVVQGLSYHMKEKVKQRLNREAYENPIIFQTKTPVKKPILPKIPPVPSSEDLIFPTISIPKIPSVDQSITTQLHAMSVSDIITKDISIMSLHENMAFGPRYEQLENGSWMRIEDEEVKHSPIKTLVKAKIPLSGEEEEEILEAIVIDEKEFKHVEIPSSLKRPLEDQINPDSKRRKIPNTTFTLQSLSQQELNNQLKLVKEQVYISPAPTLLNPFKLTSAPTNYANNMLQSSPLLAQRNRTWNTAIPKPPTSLIPTIPPPFEQKIKPPTSLVPTIPPLSEQKMTINIKFIKEYIYTKITEWFDSMKKTFSETDKNLLDIYLSDTLSIPSTNLKKMFDSSILHIMSQNIDMLVMESKSPIGGYLHEVSKAATIIGARTTSKTTNDLVNVRDTTYPIWWFKTTIWDSLKPDAVKDKDTLAWSFQDRDMLTTSLMLTCTISNLFNVPIVFYDAIDFFYHHYLFPLNEEVRNKTPIEAVQDWLQKHILPNADRVTFKNTTTGHETHVDINTWNLRYQLKSFRWLMFKLIPFNKIIKLQHPNFIPDPKFAIFDNSGRMSLSAVYGINGILSVIYSMPLNTNNFSKLFCTTYKNGHVRLDAWCDFWSLMILFIDQNVDLDLRLNTPFSLEEESNVYRPNDILLSKLIRIMNNNKITMPIHSFTDEFARLTLPNMLVDGYLLFKHLSPSSSQLLKLFLPQQLRQMTNKESNRLTSFIKQNIFQTRFYDHSENDMKTYFYTWLLNFNLYSSFHFQLPLEKYDKPTDILKKDMIVTEWFKTIVFDFNVLFNYLDKMVFVYTKQEPLLQEHTKEKEYRQTLIQHASTAYFSHFGFNSNNILVNLVDQFSDTRLKMLRWIEKKFTTMVRVFISSLRTSPPFDIYFKQQFNLDDLVTTLSKLIEEAYLDPTKEDMFYFPPELTMVTLAQLNRENIQV